MAVTSYNAQPDNPSAFDFHAYYGGIPGRLNEHGTPVGHGHFQSNQNGVIHNRMPAPRALGQIAVGGQFHD